MSRSGHFNRWILLPSVSQVLAPNASCHMWRRRARLLTDTSQLRGCSRRAHYRPGRSEESCACGQSPWHTGGCTTSSRQTGRGCRAESRRAIRALRPARRSTSTAVGNSVYGSAAATSAASSTVRYSPRNSTPVAPVARPSWPCSPGVHGRVRSSSGRRQRPQRAGIGAVKGIGSPAAIHDVVPGAAGRRGRGRRQGSGRTRRAAEHGSTAGCHESGECRV